MAKNRKDKPRFNTSNAIRSITRSGHIFASSAVEVEVDSVNRISSPHLSISDGLPGSIELSCTMEALASDCQNFPPSYGPISRISIPSQSTAIASILQQTASAWKGDVLDNASCDILCNVGSENITVPLNLRSVAYEGFVVADVGLDVCIYMITPSMVIVNQVYAPNSVEMKTSTAGINNRSLVISSSGIDS